MEVLFRLLHRSGLRLPGGSNEASGGAITANRDDVSLARGREEFKNADVYSVSVSQWQRLALGNECGEPEWLRSVASLVPSRRTDVRCNPSAIAPQHIEIQARWRDDKLERRHGEIVGYGPAVRDALWRGTFRFTGSGFAQADSSEGDFDTDRNAIVLVGENIEGNSGRIHHSHPDAYGELTESIRAYGYWCNRPAIKGQRKRQRERLQRQGQGQGEVEGQVQGSRTEATSISDIVRLQRQMWPLWWLRTQVCSVPIAASDGRGFVSRPDSVVGRLSTSGCFSGSTSVRCVIERSRSMDLLVAPVGAEDCGVNSIAYGPLVDSGAYRSVCPPTYGYNSRDSACDDEQLVSVTGEPIQTWSNRLVTTDSDTHDGKLLTREHRYTVANVRGPVQAVADEVDAGYEVHFGKTSWISRECTAIPKEAIILRRVGNQWFEPSRVVAAVTKQDATVHPLGNVRSSLVHPVGNLDDVGPASAAIRSTGSEANLGDDGIVQAAEVPRDEEPATDTAGTESARVAIRAKESKPPTPEERAAHMLTHLPYAAWCEDCVNGRGQDDPHKRRKEKPEIPVVAVDYGFIVTRAEDLYATILTMVDTKYQYIGASLVRQKGADEFSIQQLIKFGEELGHLNYELQSDGEPAIKALVQAFRPRSGATTLSYRQSPAHSHASNGSAEVTVKIVKGVMRTLCCAFARRYGLRITVDSAILPWIVRHTAFIYNRFQVLKSGRTPFEQLRMKKYMSPMCEIGECVLAKRYEARATIESNFTKGLWLGRTTSTDEHIVGTPTGIVTARAVRSLEGSAKWDAKHERAMKYTPWFTSPASEFLLGLDGWEPTDNCPACEQEQLPRGLKRVGRPSNHTRDCLDAFGNFLLNRVCTDANAAKAFEPACKYTTDIAPSLDIELQRELELLRLPPVSGYQEGGSSSSSAAPAAAPMDVEQRGVTRQSEDPEEPTKRLKTTEPVVENVGDNKRRRVAAIMALLPELRESCNEEAPTIDETVEWTPPDDELRAKEAEFQRLEDFAGYSVWPRGSNASKLLTLTWVMEWRSGELKARLCARPFGRQKKPRDELFCPTPMPSSIRALLILAALRGYVVRFFDISRAFLHTPLREDVWVEPPPEWPNPHNEIWKLECALYGLNESMVDFDTHFDAVVTGETVYEGFVTMSMKRHKTEPASWSGAAVHLAKHVDDGIVVGTKDGVDTFVSELHQYFLLKMSEELDEHTWVKFLAGEYKRIPGGFAQRCTPSLYDRLFSTLGLERASSMSTPGLKAEAKRETETRLDGALATTFRTATGIAMHIAMYRPDCQFSTKECARGMSSPTIQDMQRVKRLGRFYVGTRWVSLRLTPDSDQSHSVTSWCDSDWATDRIGRKSTSGAFVFWASSLVTSFARTQGTVATSLAEAEGYAMGSGAAEALSLQAYLNELGEDLETVEVKVRSDSTAGISAQSRLGLSSLMKHVQIKYLFLQDLVRTKRIKICKVASQDNIADIGTKYLTKQLLDRFSTKIGLCIESRSVNMNLLQPQYRAGNIWQLIRMILQMILDNIPSPFKHRDEHVEEAC